MEKNEKVVKIDLEEKKGFICKGNCETCPYRGMCKGSKEKREEGKGVGKRHFVDGYKLGFQDGFDMAMRLLNNPCGEGCDCCECQVKILD